MLNWEDQCHRKIKATLLLSPLFVEWFQRAVEKKNNRDICSVGIDLKGQDIEGLFVGGFGGLGTEHLCLQFPVYSACAWLINMVFWVFQSQVKLSLF